MATLGVKGLKREVIGQNINVRIVAFTCINMMSSAVRFLYTCWLRSLSGQQLHGCWRCGKLLLAR